ncbi:MAG: oligosaccharyl transferase, archaeosortase A system-associated [Dehalococcoidia bacterium]|nr:oligosaccharyl transferase, archaeosortase A system-associated [Dehalococcoidia bacterium]
MEEQRWHTQFDKRRLSPPVITLIALLVIAGISLYIRIVLPYDQVFVNGSVWFRGTDAWYHMRHIENLLYNFPHVISFDPYMLYPGGGGGPSRPFFHWLVTGIIWLVGLGSPSPHTIDAVGAYVPAILGTLTIIPVYFIGKELFNRWVGILAAALVAILPGEFLNRSLLGFTDHHVAESLFSTVTILFLILAIKGARERQISFTQLLHRDWTTITKPLIYTLLAGIFLGFYLLFWIGGLLLVFIIFAWLVIQFIIDHLRGKSTDYLCITGTPAFLIAAVMFLPLLGKGGITIYSASLLIAILTPIALSALSCFMARKALKPLYYLPTLLGLAAISFAIFHAANPSLLHSMLSKFGIFTPAVSTTILEMHPLLLPYGSFSWDIAWLNFTTSFFIYFISLGLLIYASIKEESADKTLFLVWSIVMLVAVLGQRRFSYYTAINAALLTGYFSWRILKFAGLKELLARPKQVVEAYTKAKKAKKKAKAREKVFQQRRRAAWIKVIVAGVAIFFLVFFPSIGLPGIEPNTKVFGCPVKLTQPLASGPSLIDQGWYSSLEWLKDNSPEPFGDPDFYYQLYETPFQYPETAYGVMSWWDYGYWIMRISHRMPNCSPGGGYPGVAARFFIAQDENRANQPMDEMGSRYVIIDHLMLTTKFYAIAILGGSSQDKFLETYYRETERGKLEPMTLFYPAYYRSMVVRLYNFDVQAVVPEETLVISYEEKLSGEGVWYKEITGSKSFSTYEEAETYISSQESGNYRIVSPDLFATPVPLEELQHYKLVHQSDATAAVAGKRVPSVKIFEYVKSSE